MIKGRKRALIRLKRDPVTACGAELGVPHVLENATVALDRRRRGEVVDRVDQQ